MTTSSNSIENNNLAIKNRMGRGHLPLSRAESKLKEQFLNELTSVTLIKNNNLNIRKPKARNREKKNKDILSEYVTLNSEDRKLQAYAYSLRLGCLNSDFLLKKFIKDIQVENLDITRISPNLFLDESEFESTLESSNSNHSLSDFTFLKK